MDAALSDPEFKTHAFVMSTEAVNTPNQTHTSLKAVELTGRSTAPPSIVLPGFPNW